MSDLMEYIKVLWADIHHSRNQEWKILAVLGGVFASLFVAPLDVTAQKTIMIFGLVFCGLGTYVTYAHWQIFYNKRQIISQCEKALGIRIKLERTPFPVQGIIFAVYIVLAGALVGWLVRLFVSSFFVAGVVTIVIITLGLVGDVKLAYLLRHKCNLDDPEVLEIVGDDILDKRRLWDAGFPKFPLRAELDDLAKCIKLLGQRPLKLICNELYKDESRWEGRDWTFEGTTEGVTDKKLLLNPKDRFQFSIANERSKQQFHEHKGVVEIFASHSKIGVFFVSEGKEDSLEISKGVLIVPAGVTHKVQLHGLTFVFQCTVDGYRISSDKQIVRLSDKQSRC